MPAIPDETSVTGNTILCICLIFYEKFPVLCKTQYSFFLNKLSLKKITTNLSFSSSAISILMILVI